MQFTDLSIHGGNGLSLLWRRSTTPFIVMHWDSTGVGRSVFVCFGVTNSMEGNGTANVSNYRIHENN